MSDDFGERLKAKLTRMATVSPPVASGPYDVVLAEFVRRLNEADLDLQAVIEPRELPQRRAIVTRPKYRLSNRTTLLSFWIDGSKIYVLGETKHEISSVDQLETFLDDFLDHSHFPETIEEYREIARQPVQAYLRTQHTFQSAPEDVLVLVSPEDQRRLATSQPNQLIILDVVTRRFPGAGTYDPQSVYVALDSAGFALEHIRHRRGAGDVVHMEGVPASAREAAAAE